MPHAEVTMGEENVDRYEGGGVGGQIGVGIQFTIWRQIGLTGDYKFTWATPVIAIPGGEAEIPSRSQHLTTGFVYTF
jgi:hypothetical protein